MAFWQTGAPNSGEAYGWLGRLADTLDPLGHNQNMLVNIDDHQSLAVKAMHHVPLVFDDPQKFTRRAFDAESAALKVAGYPHATAAETLRLAFLSDIAASASRAERLVREAWRPIPLPSISAVPWGLEPWAALIAADFPTKVYYVPYRNNAFRYPCLSGRSACAVVVLHADHIAAFLRDI